MCYIRRESGLGSSDDKLEKKGRVEKARREEEEDFSLQERVFKVK